MNISDLNDELLHVREALAERDRLQRELNRIESSLKEECAALTGLAETLRSESEDVRRLEGNSLVGLLYSVMGTRESRLDDERREMLAVKLKHDNAKRRVEGLELDETNLRRKLAGLRDLDERYAALTTEKERLLLSAGGEAAEQLLSRTERLAGARAQERELREALQAGEMAESGLQRAVEALESAQGWGTWDVFGGGMVASAIKHSRIDEANQAVREVQPLLQRFERELADVGSSIGISIENGGLTAFADIFIDGLLIDLIVQSRIGDSLDAARGIYQRVRDLNGRLSRRQAEALREVQKAEMERKALLEG